MLIQFVKRRYQRLDGHMKEIVSGSSVALAMKVLAAMLTFLFNVVIGRTFGAAGAGVFFLALTVLSIVSVISRIGLDNTLVRFSSIYASRGEWGLMRDLVRSAIGLSFAVSVFSAVALWLSAPWVAKVLFGGTEMAAPLRWTGLAVLPHALFWLYAQLFKGIKKISIAMFVQSVSVSLFAIVGILIIGNSYGVTGAVIVYAAAGLVTLMLGWWFWQRSLPRTEGVGGVFSMREMLSSCLPLTVVSVMNLVVNWAAQISLGIWGTSAQVGTFSAAQRTASLTSFVLMAVNTIASPKFAALHRAGDKMALGRTARQSAKLATLAASPVLLLFLTVPGWVMGMFGRDFSQGGSLLSIMAIGQFVNVATGSVAYLLMMSGNERLLQNNLLFAAAVNIVLCVTLVPSFGAVGAAIATALTMALMNLISVYFVWTRLGIITLPGMKMFIQKNA